MGSVKNTQVNREEVRNLMDAKIKKIIAREGLIIVSIAMAGGLITLLSMILPDAVLFKEILSIIGFTVLIYSWNIIYLSYLLVRFIIWAIRTLKQK